MITLLAVTLFDRSHFDAVIDESKISDKVSIPENQSRHRNKIVLVFECVVLAKIHQVPVLPNEIRTNHDRHSGEQTGDLQKGWERSF